MPPDGPPKLTHPERVLYPRDGITKADLAAYFVAVREPLLRALAGRPLAFQQWTGSIDEPGFYRQNVTPKQTKSWMTIYERPAREGESAVRHLVADRPETLLWLAQFKALTLHMWASRLERPECPDWVVFDFDPAEGRGIEQAIAPALALREMLERLGLASVPKTSGKRGLHVHIPIAPVHSHEDAFEFAHAVGGALAARLSDVTLERMKAKRAGRLYLDTVQNGYGKLVVAPYSPRAVDGAPVAAPLRWEEVREGLDPGRFTLRTMPARIAREGDIFAPALEGKQGLPKNIDSVTA